MAGQAFGVIGLEVMGRNIALNIERNGFPIAVYNRTYAKTEDFLNRLAKGKKAKGGKTVQEFVQLLERPRRILILVKAGAPVDAVIAELRPFLQDGDIVIDGGNSLFTDTEKRINELSGTGIKFFGMGVSGGEEGALWGPSLMPGGDQDAYRHLEPILKAIAAKTEDDGPCVTYIGAKGAGHFVKMVHNGIEYGDMQLIAEAYDLLKNIGGLTNRQLKETFLQWNESELKSFLIEITAKVIDFPDPENPSRSLVDMIQDQAGQKGTGKWTTQTALDLGIPIPTITAAVDARGISSMKQERVAASKVLSGPKPSVLVGDLKSFVDDVRAALYCSKICSYAQGFAMIAAANAQFKYGMKLDEIARIWKAGCIIRAIFLDEIKKAFREHPTLTNLLMTNRFRDAIAQRQDAWRRVIATGAKNGIGLPAFGASLAYYDSYRRERLPANLIQAQRDFFGAHTYERTDRPGFVHTEWTQPADK
ncbi:MAG TPA: decarboxylating NADP(+)-dependent phosphogluconate dehydrogenase [Tepidisphaeraceae bacterium]|nr:decarboxylating NADP(+)-dependent phosphogluconate dehydrogenase [Tepidisphaeraceae bacterium]